MHLNEGVMPNTDFTYEEFESMLASYYLTFKPLSESIKEDDARDWRSLTSIIDGFCERYKVQRPEEVLENPRTENDWSQAREFGSCWSTLDCMQSFWRDFGLGTGNIKGTPDASALSQMGQLVPRILERYKICILEYKGSTAMRVAQWIKEKKQMKFSEAIKSD